ncbi:DMT family transporter [Labilibacter sediminis]|nr:DMT family transporter [Labilibacter sediminis]
MAKGSISSYLNILFSMVFWAFSFVWIKIAYESFGPISTILLRLIISSAVLFLFLGLTKKLKAIKKEDYKLFFVLAFFEPFLYFMGESFGLQLVSSTLAAVIISTIPLFATLFAFLFFKEKISFLAIAGIIISFFGVGVMIFENGFQLSASLLGITLMFVAVLSTIGYSLTLKKLAHKYPPVNIIAYQNFIGLFMFLPIFFMWDYKALLNSEIQTSSILALIQLALFASSLAFILFTKAIKTLGVAKSNMFINLIPVFTAIFAWWLRGDIIDMQKIIGITIVIIGLFVSQLNRQKKNEI